MNFLLTKYLGILPQPVELSRSEGFVLDHPRGESELALLAKRFQGSLSRLLLISEDRSSQSAEEMLPALLDAFGARHGVGAGQGVRSQEDPLTRLARLAVVVRFEDGGAAEELRASDRAFAASGEHWSTILEDSHPLVARAKRLRQYSALLSLLIHTEGSEYQGESILLPTNVLRGESEQLVPHLASTLLLQLHREGDPVFADPSRTDKWAHLFGIREPLIATTQDLERILTGPHAEVLWYLGDLLTTANGLAAPERLRLVLLVSALELLVTHKPNSERFNVEDSIVKQFVLKTAALAYQPGGGADLVPLAKRLRGIYAARSDVAHGNFRDLAKLANDPEKDHWPIDDMIREVYGLLRIIVRRYLDDPELVLFLKNH